MDKDKKKKILRIVLDVLIIALIIAATAVAIFFIYKNNKEKNSEENTLSYTQLVNEVNNGNVEKLEMVVGSSSVTVKLKDVEEEKTSLMKDLQVMAFTELVQQKKLEGQDIDLIVKPKSVISQIPSYIMSILPTAIMLGLFVMIFKMQGLGEKGDVYDNTERKTKITFDDIAGLDEEKDELKELVKFLKEPKKFVDMGAKSK